MKHLRCQRIILLIAYVLFLVPGLAQDSSRALVPIPADQLRRAIVHIRCCDIMQEELMQVKINYSLLEKALANRDSTVFLLKKRDSTQVSYIAIQEKQLMNITLQKDEAVKYATSIKNSYKAAIRREKRKKWLGVAGGVAIGIIIKIFFFK